ncbi:MAG: AAA-like domain-containing protein [Spirulina sp.]
MTHLQDRMNPEKYRSVNLDFFLADNGNLRGMKEFLYWFCGGVCRELQIPNKIDEYWEEGIGNTYNCTMFFEEYILGEFPEPLALFLDNVDRLFDTQEIHEQITQDFFRMLRAWHEKSTSREIWNNLRMILSYSTEDYSLLDINCSPFNVGMMMELPEFTLEQVQTLAKRQDLSLEITEIKELLGAIGGNPRLIQRTFKSLKEQKCTVADILKTAHTESGIYSNYLRKYLSILQKYPELGKAMKKVVETTEIVKLDSILVFKLQGLGLIKVKGNDIKSRCQLYDLYFKDRL